MAEPWYLGDEEDILEAIDAAMEDQLGADPHEGAWVMAGALPDDHLREAVVALIVEIVRMRGREAAAVLLDAMEQEEPETAVGGVLDRMAHQEADS